MSLDLRVPIVFAVGILSWLLASWWCANPAECFYLAVPLVALTIFLAGVDDLRSALKEKVLPGVSIAAGLFVLGICIVCLVYGPAAMVDGRFWVEIATVLYYLAAVVIVLLTVRRLPLATAQRLHARRKFSPAFRVLLCELLPLALFVMFALPYAMAFSQVHRFKVPNVADPQTALQREYEDVEFASADGTRLRGWWISARKTSSRTLVICHGVAANRSLFLPFVEAGDWLDANVLMFDLRGHGESDGRTVTFGYREKDDVLAAVSLVRRDRPEQSRQVAGMGISLGAATMALAAAEVEPPLDAVILDSSFTSTKDMTGSAVNAFPSFCHPWLLSLGLPLVDLHAGCPMMTVSPEASIHRLRAPVLFLHSRGDLLIPSEHAIRLHQRAVEPKLLCIFEIDGHCNGFFDQRERYREAIGALTENREETNVISVHARHDRD